MFDNWKSQEGLANGQWIDLEFPVPVFVRTVRLYGARDGTLVRRATVRLYTNTSRTTQAASAEGTDLAQTGTDVGFADVAAQVVRVSFDTVQGSHASLAEIEVISAGGPAAVVSAAPKAPSGVRVVVP